MNYSIDKDNKIPAYLQLYRFFVKDISKGVYPYGSKLPSKRIIAEETGLSVITAEHAINLLNEEGYVESRERSGVFVIYRGEDFPGEDHLSPVSSSELLKDSVKNNPLLMKNQILKEEYPDENLRTEEDALHNFDSFPFGVLAKTVRRVLLDNGEKILIKSPNKGCKELRNEICLYLARSRGISVNPAQVILGSGAEYLYGLIGQLLGTGSIIAIEDPSYEKIKKVYEAVGIICDPLKMTSEGIKTGDLRTTKARILHVTPFNSFPSGVTVGISKKLEYLKWVRERGGILIEDNYDSELTVSKKAEEPLFSMDPGVNVIYLNTFSRTLAPSMRIGYMVLPAGLLEDFEEKLGFYSCTIPVLDQYVLELLLKSGEYERHINRIRRKRRAATE